MARHARKPLPAGFGALWTTVAVDLVGFGIVLPILPLYARRYHATSLESTLLVAAFSAASFVFSPLWGRVSDRVGRKPVLIISLVGTAVGSLVTGLAGGLAILFVGRLLDGISGSSVSVAQASVADLAAPAERPRLFGLLGAAFGIGFVAGPAIGALGAVINPRLPFLIAAGIAGVNALVALRRLPATTRISPPSAAPSTVPSAGAEEPGTRPAAAHRSFWSLIARRYARERGPETPARRPSTLALVRQGDVGGVIAVAFLAMVAFSGFEATFALFGHRHLGFSLGSSAGVFACVGAVIVIVQGGLVHPVVAKLGQAITLRVGLGLNAVGLLLLAPARGWALAVPALLALTIGQGLVQTTMTSTLAGSADPARRGELLGVQQSAGGLARVIGPILGGALLGTADSGVPYLVGGVLTAAALAVLFVAIPGPAAAGGIEPSGGPTGDEWPATDHDVQAAPRVPTVEDPKPA
jgi:MFS transporter, DHA1 family, tetracycline resistance protein